MQMCSNIQFRLDNQILISHGWLKYIATLLTIIPSLAVPASHDIINFISSYMLHIIFCRLTRGENTCNQERLFQRQNGS